MDPHVIKVDYKKLEEHAARMAAAAEELTVVRGQVRDAAAELSNGGWQGRGAAAFAREMEGEVDPAMDRLIDALSQSQTLLLKLVDLYQEAEEEAARPFKGTGFIDTLAAGIRNFAQRVSQGVQSGIRAFSELAERGRRLFDSMPPWLQKAMQNRSAPESGMSNYDLVSLLTTIGGVPLTAPSLYSQARLHNLIKGWFPKQTLSYADNAFHVYVTENKFLKWGGRGFAALDFGSNLVKTIDNPDFENIADTTASGLGVVGAVFSGPGAMVAGAFSLGYAIGDNLVPDSVKNAAGDLMYDAFHDHDEYMIENYPVNTVNDYERNGKIPPPDVARKAYQAMVIKYPGSGKAQDFWDKYKQQTKLDSFYGEGSYPSLPFALKSLENFDRHQVEYNRRPALLDAVREKMNEVNR